MTKQSSLYSEQLMALHREPVGWCDSVSGTFQITRHNPFCGDELTLGLSLKAEKITRILFSGECCAVCRAAASLLCQSLERLELSKAQLYVSQVLQALNTDATALPDRVAALQVVKAYPVRLQCARLPWQAVKELMEPISVAADPAPPLKDRRNEANLTERTEE